MKLKVFQTFYRDDQISELDHEFEPFDNRANPSPELMEFYCNMVLYDRAEKEKLDLWGNLSWTWKNKLSGMTANDVIERINSNPGYDVYFFNGFYDQVFQHYNVWEQGFRFHTNIIDIIEHAAPLMEVDPKWIHQPMGKKVSFFACYCVGTRDFWKGYLDLVTSFCTAIPNFDQSVINKMHEPSGYIPNPGLWYFPFIQERLFSTYLVMNYQRFKILPYHHQEDLYDANYRHLVDLKEQAIETGDIKLLEQWRQTRNQIIKVPDCSESWIKNFKKYS